MHLPVCWYYFVDLYFVFFFKQKTAYEMRISDWSSDVCSSDLHACLQALAQRPRFVLVHRRRPGLRLITGQDAEQDILARAVHQPRIDGCPVRRLDRPQRPSAGGRESLQLHRTRRRKPLAIDRRGLEQHLALIHPIRSEEHTSELQSLMRISY